MKRIFLLLLLSIPAFSICQYKIAVVSATTGQTKICPTLDSAYNAAASGDYIYLPAGSFSFNLSSFNKKLNIYGTGINPDSSLMGVTSVSTQMLLSAGSNNSYFEGIVFTGTYLYFDNYGPSKVANITFKRCQFNSVVTPNASIPVPPEGISFYECIIGGTNGYGINWLFAKNIISSVVSNLESSTFTNNVFTLNQQFAWPVSNIANSTFSNNIFQYSLGNTTSNCIFYNNVNAYVNATNNSIINPLSISADQIFVNTSSAIWYQNSYHLKPGCPGIGGGNDGTDVGIYGTSQPTKPGWIPSNPHVYYKKVDGQNNASGILNATFKVKAQGN